MSSQRASAVALALALVGCSVLPSDDTARAETDLPDTGGPGDHGALTWNGTLELDLGGCQAEVHETGQDVFDDPTYAEAASVVKTAEMLYLIEFDPPTACGLTPPGPELRALKWKGTHVEVWAIYRDDEGWEFDHLDTAEVIGKWEFTYDFAWSNGLHAHAWAALD